MMPWMPWMIKTVNGPNPQEKKKLCGGFHSHGGYPKIDGCLFGKIQSHLEMDALGVPPIYGIIYCMSDAPASEILPELSKEFAMKMCFLLSLLDTPWDPSGSCSVLHLRDPAPGKRAMVYPNGLSQ